jgi:hypothetical protein
MAWLGAIGVCAFVGVSLVFGARLLRLARRTRQIPEAALGAALFSGGLGYAGIVIALRALERESAPLPLALGNLLVHAGTIALAVGTWRIFREGQGWPRAIVMLLAAVLALSFGVRLAQFDRIPPGGFVFWTNTLGGALGWAWSSFEALRAWSNLRRRMALGLADPAATRRVGLWGLGTAAAVGMHVASMLGRAIAGDGMLPAVVISSSAPGLAGALCIGLAFFPVRRHESVSHAAA